MSIAASAAKGAKPLTVSTSYNTCVVHLAAHDVDQAKRDDQECDDGPDDDPDRLELGLSVRRSDELVG